MSKTKLTPPPATADPIVIGDATLHCGDCLEVMAGMEADSVDAIVTDPPYGLSQGPTQYLGEGNGGGGFMGKAWDHGVPGVAFWQEALRVAKPGSHLLAFGGDRTHHRLMVAIEDAGWEIRTCVYWVHGQGFPKSLDISKAIDKIGGMPSPPGFAEWLRSEREAVGMTAKELCELGKFYKNVNHGGLVSNWEAGIGFPDSVQFNLLCDLLHLPFDRREEVEREILGWRTVAPGVAFTSEGPSELPITAPATPAAKQWAGWGTSLKPAVEVIVVARKPPRGTVAENVLRYGTGGLNVDQCRISYADESDKASATPQGICTSKSGALAGGGQNKKNRAVFDRPKQQGRYPANLIHDGSAEVVGLFPVTTSGVLKAGTKRTTGGGYHGGFPEIATHYDTGGDTGSAARFFQCCPFEAGDYDPLFYTGKATKKDRDAGCDGLEERARKAYSGPVTSDPRMDHEQKRLPSRNHHPTLKPLSLMRYLVRLVTPTNGLILDPFMGSGSTGKACYLEGFRFTGIDLEPEYVAIARARLEHIQCRQGLFAEEDPS
jgi:DNA modification methylase/transcriptional regulator with XRE-family HTH domain